MLRLLALLYALLAAAALIAVSLYQVLFLAYYVVPKEWREPIYSSVIYAAPGALRLIPAVDSDAGGRADDAVLVNLGLLAMFILPHSLMARESCKRVWTKVVPAPVERSTYVLVSSLLLAALFWFWRPIPEIVWPLQGSLLAATNTTLRPLFQGMFWAGWALVLVSFLSAAPWDLLGLRQAWAYFRGRPYTPPPFKTRLLHRVVRHPMMLGLIIAYWATPIMTLGHLMFALVMSLYALVGVLLEERDLLSLHGEAYAQYKHRTSMLLPLRWRRG